MFFRILRKSLLKRKSRIVIVVLSVIIGAAIATALLSVSSFISEKVGLEFRKYDANLLVVPESDTIEVGFPGVEFGAVTEQKYIHESDLCFNLNEIGTNSPQDIASQLKDLFRSRHLTRLLSWLILNPEP